MTTNYTVVNSGSGVRTTEYVTSTVPVGTTATTNYVSGPTISTSGYGLVGGQTYTSGSRVVGGQTYTSGSRVVGNYVGVPTTTTTYVGGPTQTYVSPATTAYIGGATQTYVSPATTTYIGGPTQTYVSGPVTTGYATTGFAASGVGRRPVVEDIPVESRI